MTWVRDIMARLALRRALKLVRQRGAREWPPDPSERRVLIVLPVREEDARHVWRFLATLGLDPQKTLPVVPVGEVTYAPVDYLGHVRILQPADIGRLGLPKKAFLRDVWSFQPDVAFCFAAPFDLAPAVVAGASPAAFRIGFHGEGAEPFFDLLASGDDVEGRLRALRHAMEHISPPILIASQRPAGGGTPAW
jgi:hypothetical protein